MIDRRGRFRPVVNLLRAAAPALLAIAASAAWLHEPLAAETSALEPAACDPGGLAPLLTPGRILLFGEIHGTVEGPAAVASVACAALRRSLPVAVALEIPVEENDRIQQFLASDGAETARERLLAGAFWQRDYQDGRSSRAMHELLEALRRLARSGGRLEVVLIDPARPDASGQQRDDEMARRLVSFLERSDASGLLVALTGNFHSRTTVGTPFDANYRPAGLAVASRWPERVLSVLLVSPSGTAWTCTDGTVASCSARSLTGGSDREGGRLELLAAPKGGHSARLHLPALTASPPATTAH